MNNRKVSLKKEIVWMLYIPLFLKSLPMLLMVFVVNVPWRFNIEIRG